MNITGLDQRLRRRSLIGYALGMGLYTLVVVAMYPAFKNSTTLDEFTEQSPGTAALFGISGSLTSPTGWLNANIYNNFLPLIVLLIAIGYGAACIAGQDEDQTLGFVATLPLTRRRIAAEKLTAMAALLVPVIAVTFVCALAGRAFDLDVDVWHLLGVSIAVLLLGLAFGALAMLIGALTGARASALGITSAVAATTYLLNSLAPVVDWLKPARYLSPFFYAVGDNQLDDGLSPWWALVLLALVAVLVGTTLIAFERLDIH